LGRKQLCRRDRSDDRVLRRAPTGWPPAGARPQVRSRPHRRRRQRPQRALVRGDRRRHCRGLEAEPGCRLDLSPRQAAVRPHRNGRGECCDRRPARRSVAGRRLEPGDRVPTAVSVTVVSDELVQILDGNTFVVSDDRGDISASLTDPTGLFSYDTRFLSKWVLTVDGQRLNQLSVDDLNYFETRFFLVPGTGTVYVDSKLSVLRRRSVGEGFREELTILNHQDEPVDLTVRVEAGADFA